MMAKFKFGDYVHQKMHGFGVITSHVKYDCAHVRFESMEEKWCNLKELKLVPPPDTVRLDWLEQQMLGSTMNQIIYDGYCFGAVGSLNNEIFDTGLESMRDAIDFAISEDQKD